MSKIKKPFLSIVIPCYNSGKYIENCLISVTSQATEEVEIIVIDNSSTDSTMSIINKYKDKLNLVISEKDMGQSDALNKGFELSKGRFLTWLNSDDIILEGSLKKILSFMKKERSRWYAANSSYIDKHGYFLKFCASGKFENWALKYGILNVFGPSTIFEKKLFLEAGKFNLEYHYCMDTEYWWRLVYLGLKYKRIPVFFWGFRIHDDSKTSSAIMNGLNCRPLKMIEEGIRIKSEFFPTVGPRRRLFGKLLVRIYRIINGSYVSSLLVTICYRGKKAVNF